MVKRGNNDEPGRSALTIFARAPVPGRVKTRVAREVGEASACALYRAMLQDTFALARVATLQIVGCDAWVTCTPEDAFADGPHSLRPLWDGPYLPQRGTDLGERMLLGMEDLRARGYERVVIIGSDAPDIPPALIGQAFEALRHTPVVLGPARDGGYYLIGSRVPLPSDALSGVTWSASTTLQETRQALAKRGVESCLIGEWSDVDTLDDLRELGARLRQHKSHASVSGAWLRTALPAAPDA